jgi:HAD superfamily hydrolase (TIGR01509 family)
MRHFDLLAAIRLSLKPGAIELLDTLDDLWLPRAIATSSAHQTVERHLIAHNLVGRFHQIVGHGDYASGKPAPDSFLKAAERMGVEPRLCLALEDSHNGVRSASAAGMMTVQVDLGAETLALKLHPLARLSGSSVSVPVLVEGPLHAPNGRLDASGLDQLGLLIDAWFGGDRPQTCSDAGLAPQPADVH